jgi:hypothetical protein
MVVGGLDSLDRREQPQRRVQSQDVGAKRRRLRIRAGATLLQSGLEFARDRVQPRLQARPVQFAAAELPPVGEEAFDHLLTHPADCFSGSSPIDQLLKIALQVYYPNAINKLRATLVIPYRSSTRPYTPRLPRQS